MTPAGRVLVGSLAAATFAAAPLVLDTYAIYLVDLLGVWIILALGLDILLGHTGQISLGHAAFAGIGGYAATILTVRWSVPFWLSAPLAAALSAVAGFLLGLPALKLRGYSMALLTLAFGEVVEAAIRQWTSVTGGNDGLAVPPPAFGHLSVASSQATFYVIWPVTVGCLFFVRNVVRSRNGRAFACVREDAMAAQAVGINLRSTRLQAFVLSALLAGLAGALYSALNLYLHPDDFNFSRSVWYLTMVVIGGAGTAGGPAIGAGLLTLIPEALRPFKEVQDIVFAGLLLVTVIILPRGTSDLLRSLGRAAATAFRR